MRTKIVVAALACFLQIGAFAQKTFSELNSLDDKMLDKLTKQWIIKKPDLKEGGGLFPDLARTEIKKVALVAFTVYSPEPIGKTTTGKALSEEGLNHFASKLYELNLPVLKQEFSNSGIDLITIETMTDEQKQILSDFASTKWMERVSKSEEVEYKSNFLGYEQTSRKTGVAMSGYRNWRLGYVEFNMAWLSEPMHDLAKAMGVDAVLYVNHRLSMEGKLFINETVISLTGCENAMTGGKKKFMTVRGLPVTQIGLGYPKPIQIATFKRKDIETETYDGFDQFVGRLTSKMLNHLKTRTEEMKAGKY
jgi:hypothetical protein